MEKSNFSKRFWGIVFALTFLASVGAVAKALAATEAVNSKNLQALPAATTQSDADTPKATHPDEETASAAGKDFSSGGASIGRGFVKGTKVTGRAFKTAGKTMAKGFKKAGSTIRDYFMGKQDSEVKESDLGEAPEDEALTRDSGAAELDAVGNDLPVKAEPSKLSKQPAAENSEVN